MPLCTRPHVLPCCTEHRGVYSSAGGNSTRAIGSLSPAMYNGSAWGFAGDPLFWYKRSDALPAGLNAFTITILPWVVFNGWSCTRWSTLWALLAVSFGVNILSYVGRGMVTGAGAAQGRVWDLASLALAWAGQLIPAVCAPIFLFGSLWGLIRGPVRLQLVVFFALVAFAFMVVSVIVPAFTAASPVFQAVLRVVIFTFGFELAIAAMRVSTKLSFSPLLPRDRLVAMAGQSVLVAGITGRFLTSSMDSTVGTIAVAFAISVTELTLRLTLPARDRAILAALDSLCGCCRARRQARPLPEHLGQSKEPGGPEVAKTAPGEPSTMSAPQALQGGSRTVPRPALLSVSDGATAGADPLVAKALAAAQRRTGREAQDIHAYFSLLTLDTMAEDVGILTTLPFALLFRLPARIGGLPPSIGDVLIRVGMQYVLEILTDLGPAIMLWCVHACCGVRWRKAQGADVRRVVKHRMLDGTSERPSRPEWPATPAITPHTGLKWVPMSPHGAPQSGHSALAQADSPRMLDDSTPAPAETMQLPQPAPRSRSCCCTAPCVLQPDDEDVMQHRARLVKAYAAEVRDVTRDPLWQPIEWDDLLALGVGGTRAALDLRGRADSHSSWSDSGLDSEHQHEESSETEARVLFAPVRRLQDMTTLQRLAAWLAIRSETLAVRLNRAWETRFRGFNVLFLTAAVSSMLLASRSLMDPAVRCMLRDPSGGIFFDFCPAED